MARDGEPMTEGLSVADARLDFARERLDAIRAQDLGRRLTRVDAGPEPWVTVGGRRMLNLSSNNYLGLATHPKVTAAMAEAARWYGSGAGSSRLVAGTSPLHEAFEADLARFKGVDRALRSNNR